MVPDIVIRNHLRVAWFRLGRSPMTKRSFPILKKHLAFAIAILSVVAVPHCLSAQETATHFAALSPGERIANLDVLKDQLRQYHDCKCTCGCYARDLDVQADRAIAFLRQRAAHRCLKEKLAVVLDIDETTLSNYAEMTKADFAYDSKAFGAWVDSAAAPAIPGTLRLYKEAQRLGVSVFFVTGRAEAERAATERNLRAQGFDAWQQLILRSPAQANLTARDYKSAQLARIEAQGYRIVLNVGDQWSDLKGKPEAEYSVKYPDPFYFLK
jgi:acid phosphatase